MLVKTLRFGELEAEPEQVVYFPWGLPGFPEVRKFIPIQYKDNSPITILQSLELPELTFIIADPFQLVGNYVVDIPKDDLEALQIAKPEEAAVYVILTFHQGGKQVTANLLAPLIFNTAKKTARQVLLINSPYNTRYPLHTSRGDGGK